MPHLWIRVLTLALVSVSALVALGALPAGRLPVAAQQPTGSIATVTGTPTGPIITVTNAEQINVRSGPNVRAYPIVGFMFPLQQAPAIGRSPGGDWILIYFPGVAGDQGWVYAPLVSLSAGFLPIVEPPPTPTPQTTATLDPTLVAAYITPILPTRMPTFTVPPPLVIPSFGDEDAARSGEGVPAGLVIFGLAFIGGFGIIVLYLRR